MLKKIFFSAVNKLPMRLLNRNTSIEVLLPYHHVVSDDYLPHIKGIYSYKSQRQFIEDLDWLLKYRKPVHPDELMRCLREKRPFLPNTFLLTFDDGFREVYEVVAPLLIRKGVPALFFINPAFIDNKELFYRNKLSLILEKIKKPGNEKLLNKIATLVAAPAKNMDSIKKAALTIHYPQREKVDSLGEAVEIDFGDFLHTQKPYMTEAQLKELAAKGFVIGGHSMDHPHYKLITEEEQLKQTVSSTQYAKEITGSTNAWFSFPHEDKHVKQSFFNTLLADTGSSNILLFGVQNQLRERNNHMLHRFNAEEPSRSLESMTKGILVYDYVMERLKRNKVIR